jgi:RNA polymerase sigma factor for flagellar operon FliA
MSSFSGTNYSNVQTNPQWARCAEPKILNHQGNKQDPSFSLPSPPSAAERDDLILMYLPFVKYIAYKVNMKLSWKIPREDLINAGVIGLMDALNKYDSKKNTQFKTYAEFKIRGAMLDDLRRLDSIPRSIRLKSAKLEKVYRYLEKGKRGPVEDEEVARAMDLSLEGYYGMLNEVKVTLLGGYKNSPFHPSDTSADDPSTLADKNQDNDPYHFAVMKERRSILARAINRLTAREKIVISLYYCGEVTLLEIGKILGFTEARICQIHKQAIRALRERVGDSLSERAC